MRGLQRNLLRLQTLALLSLFQAMTQESETHQQRRASLLFALPLGLPLPGTLSLLGNPGAARQGEASTLFGQPRVVQPRDTWTLLVKVPAGDALTNMIS